MDKNGRMTHIERWTTRPPMYWMLDDVKEVMEDDSLTDRECEIILDQALRRTNVFRLGFKSANIILRLCQLRVHLKNLRTMNFNQTLKNN